MRVLKGEPGAPRSRAFAISMQGSFQLTTTMRRPDFVTQAASANTRSTIFRETSSRCRAIRCGLPSSVWAAIPVAVNSWRPSESGSRVTTRSRTTSTTTPDPLSASDLASADLADSGEIDLRGCVLCCTVNNSTSHIAAVTGLKNRRNRFKSFKNRDRCILLGNMG